MTNPTQNTTEDTPVDHPIGWDDVLDALADLHTQIRDAVHTTEDTQA